MTNSLFGGKTSKINEILSPFLLDQKQYLQVRDALDQTMSQGLSLSGNSSSSIKMIPSYVTSRPQNEKGKFVALDLGGTNFRVLMIDLKGDGNIEMLNQIYEIPHNVRYGNSDALFDHIATCMCDFFDKNNIDVSKESNSCPIPLGFTFSFPCLQNGLNNAVLMRWTKDFNVEGVVGENVVDLLHTAINKKEMNVHCFAVVNDTVGTLLSCALEDSETGVGLIIGTGTNAAYAENVENIECLESKNSKMMIINTEWGAFGGNGELDFVRTEVDRAIDNISVNMGQQIFEKMISGFYMGEMVRLILLSLVAEDCFSEALSDLPTKMGETHSFLTKYVSQVSNDLGDDLPVVKSVLAKFNLATCELSDLNLVKHVCKVISERAAKLVACGLGVLIDRVGDDCVVVGVDGALYRHHAYFSHVMETSIPGFIKNGGKFKLKLSTDGSGKGAAVAASVAYKQWKATN